MRLLFCVLCFVVFLSPVPCFSDWDWPDDTSQNLPICTLGGDQTDAKVVEDGDGNVFIAWLSYMGNLVYKIGVQKVTVDGDVLWEDNGVYGTPSYASGERYFDIVPDGSGGVFVVWAATRMDEDGDGDLENLGSRRIYAQHLGGNDGSWLWSEPLRVSLIDDDLSLLKVRSAVQDGEGGFVVAFSGNYPEEEDQRDSGCVIAQRISGNGGRIWGQLGVLLWEAWDGSNITGSVDLGFEAVSDGEGGIIVPWWFGKTGGDSYLMVQRISKSGNLLWSCDGVSIGVTSHSHGVFDQVATSDGSHGIILMWEDWRSSTNENKSDLYAQRVGGDGSILWREGGIPVCTADGEQREANGAFLGIDVAGDGNGGAVFVWEDHRPGLERTNLVFAQRVSAGGSLLWSEGGIEVARSHPYPEYAPRVVYFRDGEFLVVWSVGWDLYAQRLKLDGSRGWSADRGVATKGYSTQDHQDVVSDGKGHAVCAWQDSRNYGASKLDIYAQGVRLSMFKLTVDNKTRLDAFVESDPGGIACEKICEKSFEEGTTVVLSATYKRNPVNVVWGGDCGDGGSGCGTGNECTVTMERDMVCSVSPVFGDVNLDGDVDIWDSMSVLMWDGGADLQTFFGSAAKVSCNDLVDVVDALIIARKYLLGIGFPECEH